MSSDRLAQHTSGAPSRRRAHALELVLAPADDAAVRDRWQALEVAGVASAARHPGVTHRPHVTLAGGPRPPGEVLRGAARRLDPLLPLDLPVVGLALLGPPARVTLVELVAPPPALRGAREDLVAQWPRADGRPWVPHLTLAPRLPPEAVAAALVALGAGAAAGTTGGTAGGTGTGAARRALVRHVVALRWWDPDRSEVTVLAGAG